MQGWRLPLFLNGIRLLKPLHYVKLHMDHTAAKKWDPHSTKSIALNPNLMWSFKGWPLNTHQ